MAVFVFARPSEAEFIFLFLYAKSLLFYATSHQLSMIGEYRASLD
jgi:hypothetical protein